jgi:hypothetical protein
VVSSRIQPVQQGDPVRIGPYRVVGRLGAGGMGTVYAALCAAGERIIAHALDGTSVTRTGVTLRPRRHWRPSSAAPDRLHRSPTAPATRHRSRPSTGHGRTPGLGSPHRPVRPPSPRRKNASPPSSARALASLVISNASRAGEVLGIRCGDLDWGDQVVRVRRKGTGAEQWLPASNDAFVWLRLYLDSIGPLAPSDPVWWTLRRLRRGEGPSARQPLNYDALRAVLRRVNGPSPASG